MSALVEEEKRPLTTDEKRFRVLQVIHRCITETGWAPTHREIGDEIGISSTNGVHDHLRALVQAGYLNREPQKSRAMRITEKGLQRLSEEEGLGS